MKIINSLVQIIFNNLLLKNIDPYKNILIIKSLIRLINFKVNSNLLGVII
jgi:hypothetical protein